MSSPSRIVLSAQELITKMDGLTQQMEQQLINHFETSMGVPLPTAVQAEVRELTYAMVYSTDPIVDHYMNGALQILNAAFTGDEAAVATKALNVVGVLLNNIVGGGKVQTGFNGQSIRIPQGGKTYISAAYTLVSECSAQDWATQTNFYVSYYAFVVWQPSD